MLSKVPVQLGPLSTISRHFQNELSCGRMTSRTKHSSKDMSRAPSQHNDTKLRAGDLTDPSNEAIVDNRSCKVGDFLRRNIKAETDLAIVSAYFTIYAYEALRDELEQAGTTRFLYGDPTATSTPDTGDDSVKSFKLNEEGNMELQQALKQKLLARACEKWIQQKVEIRTIKQANFLHGKLYHASQGSEVAALTGSSNFTLRGLGFGATPNVELNMNVRNTEDRTALINWFNNLWADENLTSDAKDEVIAALERLSQPYAPEFVYYKTLFHVFEERLKQHEEHEGILDSIDLRDTEVWKKLYDFQRHGVIRAINCLGRHNGCIVADSVGLGKTWTALAVIKFFELRNERVLVLCPKRLKDNWVRYTARAASRHNPFDKDRLNYVVLAHTDLSRYEGHAEGIDLTQFNWGAFDLVVIDESHNFRNQGQDRYDENNNLVSRSRYNRLLEEVLKEGAKSKVLLLSATPVNTSLQDLRNQIYLITQKNQNTFRKTLGIGSIQSTFAAAEREFKKWDDARRSGENLGKTDLLKKLGAGFLTLLDTISFARSRTHLTRYYSKETDKIGGFPKREKPRNLYPETDRYGELPYDELHQSIGEFRLAVYMPSQYLKDTSSLEREKAELNFDQRDRENSLISMLRVNLLKRLESSVHAFRLTLERILEKMEKYDQNIERLRKSASTEDIDFQPDDDEEDEEFEIGKAQVYRLDELHVDRLQEDLREDRQVLEKLLQRAKKVEVERDQKLAELKQELEHKVKEPPRDKDNRANRKVIVFTTFADTACYLYDNLKQWVRDELNVHIALVTGGDRNQSTTGASQFMDILSQFAPQAQNASIEDGKIDIVIATDCLSEGQNLQDCDLVVNYDIHWNPVRLMQRFGRIDRLGSRNLKVQMVNFWPTKDLDQYLDLKNRVEARMVLADVTATGLDDPLNQDTRTEIEQRNAAQMELTFRDEQLKRIQEESFEIEETDDSINLSDFTLDDFIADLLNYIQQHKATLEAAPFGIHAIVDNGTSAKAQSAQIQPGVIFCLKRSDKPNASTPNRLWPYFLIYIQNDGSVRYTFQQTHQCLALFRDLAAKQPDVFQVLEDAFDHETQQGRRMKKYDALLSTALQNITSTFKDAELSGLVRGRDSKLTKKPSRPDPARDFTLVTWLIIAQKETE